MYPTSLSLTFHKSYGNQQAIMSRTQDALTKPQFGVGFSFAITRADDSGAKPS